MEYNLKETTRNIAKYFSRSSEPTHYARAVVSTPPNTQSWKLGNFEVTMYTKATASKPGFATIRLDINGEAFDTLRLGSVLLPEAQREYIILQDIVRKLSPMFSSMG